MDGERISLRLETEDLELLDEFIEKHPEYSNRSNLARVAFRSFIEQIEGAKKTSAVKNDVEDNVISVKVPLVVHNTIMNSVRVGIYNSAEDAIVECLRKRFAKTDEILENIMRADLEALKNTVQVLPE